MHCSKMKYSVYHFFKENWGFDKEVPNEKFLLFLQLWRSQGRDSGVYIIRKKVFKNNQEKHSLWKIWNYMICSLFFIFSQVKGKKKVGIWWNLNRKRVKLKEATHLLWVKITLVMEGSTYRIYFCQIMKCYTYRTSV